MQQYSGALLAAELIQQRFKEDSAIWAASECQTMERAIQLLQQECELCTETYPMNKIVSMLKCTHTCCFDCAKNYFTIQVANDISLFLITKTNLNQIENISRLPIVVLRIVRVHIVNYLISMHPT